MEDKKEEEKRSTELARVISYNADIDSLEELNKAIQESYLPCREFFGEDVEGIGVEFLYTRDEMDKIRGEKTQDWVVGCSRNKRTVTIFSPSVFDKVSPHPASDFLPVLAHEIAHVFEGVLFNLKYPRWLSEGLAGYIAQQYKLRVPDTKKIQDFSQIHDGNGWDKTNPYSQAYSFTAYLIENFGKEKMLNLLKSLTSTGHFDEFSGKFAEVYGQDFDVYQADWKKGLEAKNE